jgi:hypothetical protein
MHLDEPLPQRYCATSPAWCGSIWAILRDRCRCGFDPRARPHLRLAIAAVAIAVVASVGIGVVAAAARSASLPALMGGGGVSVPVFWLGVLLIYVSTRQPPRRRRARLRHIACLVLPDFSPQASTHASFPHHALRRARQSHEALKRCVKGRPTRILVRHACLPRSCHHHRGGGRLWQLPERRGSHRVDLRVAGSDVTLDAILSATCPPSGAVLFMAVMFMTVNLVVDISIRASIRA